MATDLPQYSASTRPTGHRRQDDQPDPPAVRPILARPRSEPGTEAYLRSELEQAAIDIAAGR